jgi:hypothetical protein
MDLARNTEKYLRHGWFVVRNRTPSEVQEAVEPLERHIREISFFNTAPWKALPAQRRGTQALKKFLADLLSDRILESFPTMLTTLRDRIRSTTSRLQGLGAPRGTVEEKRAFLTKIAQEYSTLTSQSLRGRYDSLAANNVKLRRLIRDLNDKFSHEMEVSGHAVPFLEQSEVDKDKNLGQLSTPTMSLAKVTTNGKDTAGAASLEKPKAGSTQSGASSVRAPLPFTKNMSFPEYAVRELGTTIINKFQNIYMEGWTASYSFEELRLNDYNQERPTLPKSTLFKSPLSSQGLNGQFQLDGNQNHNMFSFHAPTSSSPNPWQLSSFSFGGEGNQSREFSEIYKWIKVQLQANRGTELQGTFNPDVLPALFHKQIIKWKSYSEAHFMSVTKTTVETLGAILTMVCPDPVVRARLEKAVSRASDAAAKKGLNQLFDRLATLSSAHLQTNNPAFVEKVRASRLQRFQAALERFRSRQVAPAPAPAQVPHFGSAMPAPVSLDSKFTIDMRDTASLFDELHVSNSQNLEDEIHDLLKAYYEIARDDFIEFVNHFIVEPYLNRPDGPVLFFSPLHVSAMSPEQLESLAVEPASLLRERADLESALVRLKHAEAIAEKYS